MKKTHYLVIVDQPNHLIQSDETRTVISAQDYILGHLPESVANQRYLKVINLCNDYKYLRAGYYCSLLAEARHHRCLPSASDIAHARWKRVYKDSLVEVSSYVSQLDVLEEMLHDEQSLTFFLGRSNSKLVEPLGRKLFDLFRLPMMRVHFTKKANEWRISEVEPLKLAALGEQKLTFFNEALSQYIGSYWTKTDKNPERYWLAILHDEDEPMPPSNKKALEKLVKIGRKRRFFVELITKNKFDSLLEYDALFIRATTNVNHYTYRFAQKAFREDIPCIDDKDSILRCCNKVYLSELLKAKKIATPKTFFVSRQQKSFALPEGYSFPLVVKIPDGSFSTGVFKVEDADSYQEKINILFKDSELVLVQEFLYSEYDWRIGVLDGKPLFACKYFMAKKHWQIFNYSSKSKKGKEGDFSNIALDKVPPYVLKLAVKAASLIGKGLYGVDVKERDGKAYVIEVNDNPNIDAGVEDKLEGDKIYEAIFDYFEREINA